MVAAYLQVARSAQLAHWVQQTRERSLERRAERVSEMREILEIQHQIDAQQPQAQLLANATSHFRAQAKNLARFARAGLTFEDFERMGVGDVVDMEDLKRELERIAAEPESSATPPADDVTRSEDTSARNANAVASADDAPAAPSGGSSESP